MINGTPQFARKFLLRRLSAKYLKAFSAWLKLSRRWQVKIEQWTVAKIKEAFCAVIRVLQAKAERQSDWLAGMAKIAQLEIFLAHAQQLSEREELLRYCCAVLEESKGIGLPASGGYIFGIASRKFRNEQKVDLKSVLFAGLEKLYPSGKSR
jgi:hypothetical protein